MSFCGTDADVSAVEQDYVDRVLADAWRSAQKKFGRSTNRWNAQARRQVTQRKMGYFVSLDGFPTLDPQHDLRLPALTPVDGGTIRSQAAQSYTQWVPLHAPDTAQTLLPIGPSEHPDRPSRTSNMRAWEQGQLHPAPLSRTAVEEISVDHVTLQE